MSKVLERIGFGLMLSMIFYALLSIAKLKDVNLVILTVLFIIGYCLYILPKEEDL